MSRYVNIDKVLKCLRLNHKDVIYIDKNECAKRIKALPSIDIEPKRGEWIDEADKYDASFGIHDYRCSNCNSYADEYIGGHEWYTMYKPNYCPYCGADMRERKESDDA